MLINMPCNSLTICSAYVVMKISVVREIFVKMISENRRSRFVSYRNVWKSFASLCKVPGGSRRLVCFEFPKFRVF